MNKTAVPKDKDLEKALGGTYESWKKLAAFTKKAAPAATEEWNFSGEKYGWSFRIKDKKRVLLYLLPRDKFFKAAFVFGQKATDQIMQSEVSAAIKAELKAARVYAEGRGIRIEVKEKSGLLGDLEQLIRIKTEN